MTLRLKKTNRADKRAARNGGFSLRWTMSRQKNIRKKKTRKKEKKEKERTKEKVNKEKVKNKRIKEYVYF